jgi:hypothetical protein
MSKISLVNMLLGFVFIFLSASAGFFLSEEFTRAHVMGGTDLNSWWLQLSASAHGHTNLFGIVHIMLGLTFPYSFKNTKIKVIQTIGMTLGSIAMSFLLYYRAGQTPSLEYDLIGILIGVGLTGTLVAIGLQILGISLKLNKAN